MGYVNLTSYVCVQLQIHKRLVRLAFS